MPLHLIKLSVGPESLSDLESWQKKRLQEKKRAGEKPELIHITRNTPKRGDKILESGGSIYWVIKGWIVARQQLLEFRPLTRDGVPHCGLVYDRQMVHVRLRPHRPFQGWRYFEGKDAPPDVKKGSGEQDLPEEMRRELSALGLL